MSETLSQDSSHLGGNTLPAEPALVIAFEAARPWAGGQRFAITDLDDLEVGRGEERALDVRVEHGRRIGRVSVPDPWMSAVHFRLHRRGEVLELADAGSKNGTSVDGERCALRSLEDGVLIEAARTAFVFQHGRAMPAVQHDGLATFDPDLAAQVETLRRLARTDLPLLLRGPTGSGKEVAASACHDLSGRTGPFVAINLAAVPPSLLESELFGHRRGAFTGAVEDRAGVIRGAHRGTLFLDEIAELSPAGQSALLRVLQQREVMPVGGPAPIAVDIRVIAATHEDLAARIAAGSFRQDLFARIAGHQLVLPPLRQRRVDLGLLVARILPRIAGNAARQVRMSRSAVRMLFDHSWPMNIRELEHTLVRALALAGDAEIEPAHLSFIGEPATAATAAPPDAAPRRDRSELVRLLGAHAGNVTAVARALGTSPSHVRRLLQRHEIDLGAVRRELTPEDE